MSRRKTGKRISLTERDLEILRLLDRYRYLRSSHLHVLAGGKSHKRFVERLGDLYHEAGFINRPPQQWQAINARYMPAVYELGEPGRRLLAQYDPMSETGMGSARKPLRGAGRQFHHELMVCDILSSMEIGVRANPDLRFIPWAEILASPKMPEATRESLRPMSVKAAVTHQMPRSRKAHRFDRPLVPDALFGLEYTVGGQKRYRFFALEADRNTEPVTRGDLRQSSYLRKVLQYREIAARSIYKSHWGLPNLFVLNVTVNQRHEQNIMRLVDELTGGKGIPSFLFKTMPSLASLEKAPLPEPDMLTEAWHRAGQHDFLIDRP